MENFTVIKKLGSGSFGTVMKVKRKEDDQIYACKKVNISGMDSKDRKNALNEVRILASLNHPQIISYKEAFYEEDSKSLCIIMEFAEGGDLQHIVDSNKKGKEFLTEKEIWKYTIQLISGIKYLHEIGIVHRDLKCANIFLTKKNDVKLGDLNVSKVNKGGLMFTQTGVTRENPEVWNDKPYDAKSDIWSLGCILYELCANSPPFTAKDMKGLYNKVIKGEYSRIPEHYSQDLANVIDMCLRVASSKRPTAAQLLRTKEIVLHLKENKIEEEKGSISLLDTIKLPSDLRLIKDRLPSAKYSCEKEEIKGEISEKYRGFSARGRKDDVSILGRKPVKRDASLSVLQEDQSKLAQGINLKQVKAQKRDYASLLPPKSNRPAKYRKDSDNSVFLPPLPRPAGMPTLGLNQNLRQRSETRDNDSLKLNNLTNQQNIGHHRKVGISPHNRLQQQLISQAFGLPSTPLTRNQNS